MRLRFQTAVVATLVGKCKRALQQTGMKKVVVAGGVSANVELRAAMTSLMTTLQGEVFYARPEFCTDNGAMVAHVGNIRLRAGASDDLSFHARPRWPMSDLEK